MRSYRLKCADYQELLDRGWRRSGTYCYHPINMSTCCPNYPISCKATKFKISRSQRRCIQNLNSYLVNGLDANEKLEINYHAHNGLDHDISPIPDPSLEELKRSSKARRRRFFRSCERKAFLLNISLDAAYNIVRDKHIKRKKSLETFSLEDYLYPIETPNESHELRPKHSLEINMYQVDSEICKALRKDQHQVLQKYQNVVHKESPEDWTMHRFRDFLITSPLYVEPLQGFDHTEPSDSDTKSRFTPLYRNKNSGKYILVRPPELPTCYGTYHCVYRLDGRVIAVGVLDVLPKCVTTVYFFYDPSYGHLNLGIYSALVEISMVRQLNNHFVDTKEKNRLVHYYMGFYVHECLKMRYKTTFKPSYLLCSETCRYVPTDICLSKLVDGKKYARFSDDDGYNIYTADIDPSSTLEIPIASFIVESHDMRDYLRWAEANLEPDQMRNLFGDILEYMRLVGPSLLPHLRLILR